MFKGAPGRCVVPRLLQGPDSSGPRLAYEVAQGLEPCTAGLVEKLLPLWWVPCCCCCAAPGPSLLHARCSLRGGSGSEAAATASPTCSVCFNACVLVCSEYVAVVKRFEETRSQQQHG